MHQECLSFVCLQCQCCQLSVVSVGCRHDENSPKAETARQLSHHILATKSLTDRPSLSSFKEDRNFPSLWVIMFPRCFTHRFLCAHEDITLIRHEACIGRFLSGNITQRSDPLAEIYRGVRFTAANSFCSGSSVHSLCFFLAPMPTGLQWTIQTNWKYNQFSRVRPVIAIVKVLICVDSN